MALSYLRPQDYIINAAEEALSGLGWTVARRPVAIRRAALGAANTLLDNLGEIHLKLLLIALGEHIMGKQAELLPDLLILEAVSLNPQHGYGVLLRIAQIIGGGPGGSYTGGVASRGGGV